MPRARAELVCVSDTPSFSFEGVIQNGFQRGILFSLEDHLELVDCTGRISRSDNAEPLMRRHCQF